MDHIQAVARPFDYIIGTDVVYVEHLLEPLLQTILSLSGPRTHCNGIKKLISWTKNVQCLLIFSMQMHSRYQHYSIHHLYTMVAKKDMIPENNLGSDEETVTQQRKGESSDVQVSGDKVGGKKTRMIIMTRRDLWLLMGSFLVIGRLEDVVPWLLVFLEMCYITNSILPSSIYK